MRRYAVLVFAFAVFLLFTPAAQSQSDSLLGGNAQLVEPNWGTVSSATYTVYGHEFDTFVGTPGSDIAGNRICGAPESCGYLAGVKLQSGAQITAIELEGCDASATAEISFALFRFPRPAGITPLTGFATTGLAATPGCSNFLLNLPSPHTVDNQNDIYILDVLPTSDVDVNFRAVRVFYTLQVSPAPATATFADVSNAHPFYQYIEALAAAGITAGCTPPPNPNYCPNDSITRGQMAVFLARALGLHFPN